MAKQGTSTAVPRLRFPDFRKAPAWKWKTLSHACEMQAGKFVSASEIAEEPSEGAYPCYGGNGLRGYTTTFTHSGKYPLIGRQGALCGNIQFAEGEFYATEHALVSAPKSGVNVEWLYYTLDGLRLNRFATGQAQPGLSVDVLNGVECAVPAIEDEQQKIADCLTSLDEVITAQGRKVAALKTYKRGLMQQLFPREGETRPRLRFPEFGNGPEWKAKRLEEVAPLQRGFDLPAAELEAGNVPVVYSNGIRNYHKAGMAQGPGLVTGRSGTIGNLHYIDEGHYWPHNTSLWVTTFKGHDPKFVYFLYSAIGLIRFASGSGVPTLNRNDVHSFETSVPGTTDEQQRIADFLSSLDALIAAESNQVSLLKIHKQGLMQQLFPAPEAVGA